MNIEFLPKYAGLISYLNNLSGFISIEEINDLYKFKGIIIKINDGNIKFDIEE